MEQVRIDELYSLDETMAKEYLSAFTYPWEALAGIHDLILELGRSLPADRYDQVADDVWIAKSAKVFDSAYIGGACIIGENAQVRHCAFVRGDALIGDGAVIGNSVELKNVIIFNKCEVPHYNYVGDSILGFHAHMGAGSITSNVRADRKNVLIHTKNADLETGRYKVGAFLGDYAEIGCNAVLNPGTIVGQRAVVYPTTCARGVIPSEMILKNGGDQRKKE